MAVYARILRMPGVATIVAATAVGRLPIGITGLAILLYVQEVSAPSPPPPEPRCSWLGATRWRRAASPHSLPSHGNHQW